MKRVVVISDVHGNLAALLGKWLAFQRVPLIWNVRQSLDSIKNEKPGSANNRWKIDVNITLENDL